MVRRRPPPFPNNVIVVSNVPRRRNIIGDNARKGAVRKRSQLKVKVEGEDRWTKRNKSTGAFMAQTKTAKKFKGVRRER